MKTNRANRGRNCERGASFFRGCRWRSAKLPLITVLADTHPASEVLIGIVRRTPETGASTRRVETSGGRVREEQTRRVVGVPKSVVRCADSLLNGRPSVEP